MAEGRDGRGRFTTNNTYAAAGGEARRECLTPEQRREIAAAGFRGLVERRFGGDRAAAVDYLSDLYAWGSDKPYWGTPVQKFGRPELPPERPERSA